MFNNISTFSKYLPWEILQIIVLHEFILLDQKQLLLMKHSEFLKKQRNIEVAGKSG